MACGWHCGIRRTCMHIHIQTWPFMSSHPQTSYLLCLSLSVLAGKSGMCEIQVKTSQRGCNKRVSFGGNAYLGSVLVY